MSYIGQFKKKVIGNLRSVGTWVKMSLYCAFPSKEGKRKKPVPYYRNRPRQPKELNHLEGLLLIQDYSNNPTCFLCKPFVFNF